jgi:hypothetical protein
VSIDCCDERLLQECDKVRPRLYEVIAICVAECEVLHLLDVRACSEGFLGPGEDDGTDVFRSLEVSQGLVYFEDERCR